MGGEGMIESERGCFSGIFTYRHSSKTIDFWKNQNVPSSIYTFAINRNAWKSVWLVVHKKLYLLRSALLCNNVDLNTPGKTIFFNMKLNDEMVHQAILPTTIYGGIKIRKLIYLAIIEYCASVNRKFWSGILYNRKTSWKLLFSNQSNNCNP